MLEEQVQQLEKENADKEAKMKKLINQKKEMEGLWRKSEKQLRLQTEEAEKAKEEAKKAKSNMQECLDQFSLVVTTKMLEDMAAPLGEGLFLDGESVEAMMTNAELVIKTYCEEVMRK